MTNMNKKAKIGIIVGVLLLVGGGGAACVAGMAKNIAAVENVSNGHRTEEVEMRNISNYVSVSGNVEGANSVKIAPPANTKVIELNTELGSAVKKGELLCAFDSEDYETEYENLKKKYKLSEDQTDDTHDKHERALKIAQEDRNISLKNAEDVLNKAKNERNIALDEANDTLNKAKDERDKAYKDFNDSVKKYNDKVKDRNKIYDKMMKADYADKEEYYAKYNALDAELAGDEQELDVRKKALTNYDDAVNAAQKTYDTTLRNMDQTVSDAKKAYDAAKRQADQAVQAAQDVIDAEKYTVDDSVKQQLNDLKKKIDDCNVKAPIDGVVTALSVAEGGLPEGSSILTIEDTDVLKITVFIKEKDIMSISEGMKAEITANAIPDKTFKGTVTRVVLVPKVSMDPEGASNSSYTAEVTIDDKDTGLLLGMNAKVKITLDERTNVLSVPIDAISTDESGNDIVFIADDATEKSYKAKAVKIKKDLVTDYYVSVISDELKKGDVIILDADGIKDGESIIVDNDTYSFGGDDS